MVDIHNPAGDAPLGEEAWTAERAAFVHGSPGAAAVTVPLPRIGPLAHLFADIAQYLFDASTVGEVLERVIAAALATVEGTELASISLVAEDGSVTTPACSDHLAVAVDQAQHAAGEGPCFEVARTPGEAYIREGDLAVATRWPRFSRAAVDQGVRAVLAVGLFPDAADGARPRYGALNLFARSPHVFDDESCEMALILAVHASVALAAATAAADADLRVARLTDALGSRDVIGQAKGVLMERHRLTADQAFDMLRRGSQRLNIKLRDLAERVAETGELTGS